MRLGFSGLISTRIAQSISCYAWVTTHLETNCNEIGFFGVDIHAHRAFLQMINVIGKSRIFDRKETQKPFLQLWCFESAVCDGEQIRVPWKGRKYCMLIAQVKCPQISVARKNTLSITSCDRCKNVYAFICFLSLAKTEIFLHQMKFDKSLSSFERGLTVLYKFILIWSWNWLSNHNDMTWP